MKLETLNISPLSRISPSKFTALKKCGLSVVLSQIQPLLPPTNPASILGTVIHHMLELRAKGSIKNITEFKNNWERIISGQEKLLIEKGFPELVPLRDSIKGFSLSKIKLRKSLLTRSTTKTIDTTFETLAEAWFQSEDGKIGGKPDLVILKPDPKTIVDYKTGNVLDENGNVKEAYQDQLKIYAQLFFEKFGEYPDLLKIIDPSDAEHKIEFSHQECSQITKEAKDLLYATNSLISSQEWEKLAKPDSGICVYCRYKPICPSFWQSSFDQDSAFVDLKGVLKSLKQFRNRKFNFVIESQEDEIRIESIPARLFEHLDLQSGNKIMIFNIRRGQKENIFTTTKFSRIYEQP